MSSVVSPPTSDAAELVALPDLCAPRTLPVHHVRALIRAGRMPGPDRVLEDGTELVPADYLDELDPANGPVPDAAHLPHPWREHVERGVARFADGQRRLPSASSPERRQQQLPRMGGAAWAAALGLLMSGFEEQADEWFDRSAGCYRRSLADAEPGSWGRCIASMKARLIASDWRGARREARWTLELGAVEAASPIASYAAALALLTLGDDGAVRKLVRSLRDVEAYPAGTATTAAALRALAAGDGGAYAAAVGAVLRSFEERARFLERIPVADTVIVPQRLAALRDMEQPLVSSRLPGLHEESRDG